MRVEVNERGEFSIPQLPDGSYEIAVCADGWNPWRGTVRLTLGAGPETLTFPLELGQ